MRPENITFWTHIDSQRRWNLKQQNIWAIKKRKEILFSLISLFPKFTSPWQRFTFMAEGFFCFDHNGSPESRFIQLQSKLPSREFFTPSLMCFIGRGWRWTKKFKRKWTRQVWFVSLIRNLKTSHFWLHSQWLSKIFVELWEAPFSSFCMIELLTAKLFLSWLLAIFFCQI